MEGFEILRIKIEDVDSFGSEEEKGGGKDDSFMKMKVKNEVDVDECMDVPQLKDSKPSLLENRHHEELLEKVKTEPDTFPHVDTQETKACQESQLESHCEDLLLKVKLKTEPNLDEHLDVLLPKESKLSLPQSHHHEVLLEKVKSEPDTFVNTDVQETKACEDAQLENHCEGVRQNVQMIPCGKCCLKSTTESALQLHMKTHHDIAVDAMRQHCTPGYHAACYHHFCNITTINRAIARCRRKKEADKTQAGSDQSPHDEPPDPAPKRLLRSNIHVSDGQQSEDRQCDRKHVLPVQCIICKGMQYIKEQCSGKRKAEKLVQCETKHGGQLLAAATIKQDEALLLHIRDQDLVAIEARYHKSCYLRYTKVVAKSVEISKQEYQQQMYEKSYISFCKKVIEERIIRGKEILRLSELNQLFIKEVREIENTDASSYKTGCLKARLKRSHPVLCFARPSRQIESDIVFVETLGVEEVVD